MTVNGCDCSIAIKTSRCEMDIPYSDETLREAVSLLEEEAAVEGDGVCRAIRKINGITGCVITPLTIDTAPFLFNLAFGPADKSVYVSGTRNLYRHNIKLLPIEDTEHFNIIQDRGGDRKFFEGCRVKSFELRIMREEAIKLRLDIYGEHYPVIYPYIEKIEKESGERFNGEYVKYKVNGQEHNNIYGVTLAAKKEGGTKTEIWIKRAVCKHSSEQRSDFPPIIDEMIISPRLLRDKYENRHFGTFRIRLEKLLLISDETNVNSADTVIGPLRYYIGGNVSTEVFTSEAEAIA